VFVGTFGAGRQKVGARDGRLVIDEEAQHKKFVADVEHVTFSGAYARRRGQNVLYVTERCVLALTPEGLELVEVAPGLDIERDILARMDFRPLIPRDPIEMDARIFRPEPMNLRADLIGVPLESRFTFDPLQKVFFINLERYALHNRDDIQAMEKIVEAKLASVSERVYAIVNYDNFTILPELFDEYSVAARELADRYYSGVSRYTTSGFLRMKLGESLKKRGVAPHIFESEARARRDWRKETR
jgi:propionate CoA-transferase